MDSDDAMEYFDRYFPRYNNKHYHSGIDYVTPQQCHQRLRESIVARRKQNLGEQRRLRKEVNRLKQKVLTDNPLDLIVNPNPTAFCSVMNS